MLERLRLVRLLKIWWLLKSWLVRSPRRRKVGRWIKKTWLFFRPIVMFSITMWCYLNAAGFIFYIVLHGFFSGYDLARAIFGG